MSVATGDASLIHIAERESKKNLSILQINLRHSKAASALLVKTIEANDVDIIMLQEPYATEGATVKLANVPEGYTTHHCLNSDHRYGAAIMVRNSIQSGIVLDASHNHISCVKLYLGPEIFLLVSAYCRPSAPSLSSILLPVLQKSVGLLKGAVICLDSNAKSVCWNSVRTDEKGRELEELASRFSLSVANVGRENLPFVPAATSFVDVTLRGDNIVMESWRFLEDYSLSDHPYIFMSIRKQQHQRYAQSTGMMRAPRVGAIDKETFKRNINLEFQSVELGVVPTCRESVERFAETFTGAIITAARSSKVSRAKVPRCLAPWWNPELEELRDRVKVAYRQHSIVRSDTTAGRLREIKREYQRVVRWAHARSFREFCTKNMNKDLYVALKKVSGDQNENSTPCELRVNGNVTSDPISIMETFSSQFFPAEMPSEEQHVITEAEADGYCNGEELTAPPPVTEKELYEALGGIRRDAAPGVDGISIALIMLVIQVIKPSLINLLNGCLSCGVFPRIWKTAKVSIIRKQNKADYKEASNYRPISVLSSLGKVLEKIIQRRLAWLADVGHGWTRINTAFAVEDPRRPPSTPLYQILRDPSGRERSQPVF